MMENQKLLSLLEKAIQKEQESYDFYMDLYGRVDDLAARETLKFVAAEEQQHKENLLKYREGKYGPEALPLTAVVDYRIAEYLMRPDVEKNMQSKEAYLVAAHREKISHEFYLSLANLQPEGQVKDFFLRMAQEELRHKEKMEYLYANTAFPQTSGG